MTLIRMITTGGTIASRKTAASDDVVAAVDGHQLLKEVEAYIEGICVEVREFSNLGSFAIDLEQSFSLARFIAESLASPSVDGVVVSHGTDTMEESVWLSELVNNSEKPIVFTGAQRSNDTVGSDGPRNIGDAIRLAASPLARGLGAVIVFEQDFHAARDATKTHTSRVDTFASGEHGKLGEIDGATVSLYRKPLIRRSFEPEKIETAVDLVKMVIGMDGRFVRCAVASGAKAIVIEGFGRGNVTPSVLDAIRESISAGVLVFIASRCTQGRARPIYGGPGGGRELERAGAIFVGDLSGPKARVLAAVLLGCSMEAVEIRRVFSYFGGDNGA